MRYNEWKVKNNECKDAKTTQSSCFKSRWSHSSRATTLKFTTKVKSYTLSPTFTITLTIESFIIFPALIIAKIRDKTWRPQHRHILRPHRKSVFLFGFFGFLNFHDFVSDRQDAVLCFDKHEQSLVCWHSHPLHTQCRWKNDSTHGLCQAFSKGEWSYLSFHASFPPFASHRCA